MSYFFGNFRSIQRWVSTITPKAFWTRYTASPSPNPSSSSSPSSSSLQVIDVREREELISDGKLKRSIHLPLSDSGKWASMLHEGKSMSLSLSPSLPTVVVCAAGVRSERVAEFLSSQCKFADVYNLEGGLKGLAREVGDWEKKEE